MIEDGEDPDAEIAEADITSPACIRKRIGITQEQSGAGKPANARRGSDRADFIKRLFAVTLSVGIANQLSHIVFDPSHISNHHFDWKPVLAQWREMLLLVISLVIVVSSWEGYLAAITKFPLEDAARFYIDIALVFLYLLLTLSSSVFNLWFSIHMVIFFFYFAWDIARACLPEYKAKQRDDPEPKYRRSMTVTVVWLLYFVVIFILKRSFAYFDSDAGFAWIAVFALLGVVLYRMDKKFRWFWTAKAAASVLPIAMLSLLAYFGRS